MATGNRQSVVTYIQLSQHEEMVSGARICATGSFAVAAAALVVVVAVEGLVDQRSRSGGPGHHLGVSQHASAFVEGDAGQVQDHSPAVGVRLD